MVCRPLSLASATTHTVASAMAAKLYFYEGKRGEAEAIRILFRELKIEYTDVPVKAGEEDKVKGLLFGTLPLLEWDGIKLVEQAAILEHIAQKTAASKGANLVGQNEFERSVARALANAAEDLRREVFEFTKTKNADVQKAFEAGSLVKWFTALNKLASKSIESDNGLGPGVDLTFGDIAIFDIVNYLTVVTRSSVLRPYPNLKEWHDKTFARPNIHAYLKARPAADW